MLDRLKKTALAIFFIAFQCLILFVVPVGASSNSVMITQLQTGGAGSGTAGQEFVEIFNTTAITIDLTGWKLVYSSFSDSTNNTLVSVNGSIKPNHSVLFVSSSYPAAQDDTADAEFSYNSGISATGGHIKLVNKTGDEVDRLGWGSAQFPETIATAAPGGGQALRRVVHTNGKFIDSDDNFSDFSVTHPSPTGGGLVSSSEPEPDQQSTNYQSIYINELFPNPASPDLDEEAEFVELYNPNDEPVSLEGYILQTGSSFQYEYILPNYFIAPKTHMVLYSSETNLVLSNTSSSARIMAPDQTHVNEAIAYDNVGENEAWALYDGEWKLTETPTPGEANVIFISATTNTTGKGAGLEPCPPGKFRNPETNRCKNIESSNGLKPCQPGQTRSPATNRCRSLATGATALTPCKPGQERNPATNRCRKVAGASTSLVPCKAGYERSPETNRCRKAAGVAAGALTNTAVTTTGVNYPVLATVSMLALGYGVYEYRQEITIFLKKFSKQLLKR